MLKPLAGVRVIDFTSTISGPFCGALLADYGAEVIKVERPVVGEDARHFPPFNKDGVSIGFATLGRQKKSVSLALAQPEAQDLFRRLAAKSDVILENFTPGTMKRWNIDFETIKKINPKIVYCSISAFGQFGPLSEMPGYDAVIQALSGMMMATGFPDGPPTRTGSAATDYTSGTFGAYAIAMGLLHVKNTGEAVHMDVSMLDCVLTTQDSVFSNWANERIIQQRVGNRLQYVTPFDSFQTQDDGWIIIATANNNTFGSLCTAMGQPLLDDPRFANNALRCKNEKDLKPIIAAWTKQYSAKQLLDMLTKAGVPCAPIQHIGEMLDHPHTKARGMVQEVVQPNGMRVKIPGVAIKINGEVATIPEGANAADPGQNNHELLGGLLGLSDEELDALQKKGII